MRRRCVSRSIRRQSLRKLQAWIPSTITIGRTRITALYLTPIAQPASTPASRCIEGATVAVHADDRQHRGHDEEHHRHVGGRVVRVADVEECDRHEHRREEAGVDAEERPGDRVDERDRRSTKHCSGGPRREEERDEVHLEAGREPALFRTQPASIERA